MTESSIPQPVEQDDDTEGHVRPDAAPDPAADTTEPESFRARVTDDEDDVEGHIKMRG